MACQKTAKLTDPTVAMRGLHRRRIGASGVLAATSAYVTTVTDRAIRATSRLVTCWVR